eukprot:g61928.t1
MASYTTPGQELSAPAKLHTNHCLAVVGVCAQFKPKGAGPRLAGLVWAWRARQRAMRSCSHISLGGHAVVWNSEKGSKFRVFFDNLHERLIRCTTEELFVSGASSSSGSEQAPGYSSAGWTKYPTNMSENPEVVGAKLSPDGQFLALCIANREVRLVLANTGEAILRRRSKVSTVPMLAVHWVAGSLSLLIVTNSGVEMHQLFEHTKSRAFKLKHSKTVSYPILHHWFLPKEQALLLVDKQNNFVCYRIGHHKTGLQKLCKFTLQCAGTSLEPPPKGFTYSKKQVSLLSLYGDLCCVFVHEREGTLQVLRLRSEGMELQHTYALYSPGRYEVSVLDNVLVVHNVKAEVSLIFDTKMAETAPISSPLPLGFSPAALQLLEHHNHSHHSKHTRHSPANDGQEQTGEGFVQGDSQRIFLHEEQADHLASPTRTEQGSPNHSCKPLPQQAVRYGRVTFVAPRFILDYDRKKARGVLWTLDLDLCELARTWPSSHRPKLFTFLQNRRDIRAKHLMLDLLLTYSAVPSNLSLLSALMTQLNSTLLEHTLAQVVASGQPNNLAVAGGPVAAAVSPGGSEGEAQQQQEEEDSLQTAHNAPVGASSFNLAPRSASVVSSSSSTSLVAPNFASASSSFSPFLSFSAEPSRDKKESLQEGQEGADSQSSKAILQSPLPSSALSSSSFSSQADQAPLSHSKPAWPPAPRPTQYPNTPLQVLFTVKGMLIVTQREMISHLFLPASRTLSPAVVVPVLTEYLRSLHRFRLQADPLLHALLVELLLCEKRYHEIHQHLQYHVLADSLPLAHRLLALQHEYPPAFQLALDMLYRLQAFPTLLRTFLSMKKPVAGLKLVSHKSGLFLEPGLSPRDFLSVAMEGEDVAFFSVFTFFQKRNLHRRGTKEFAKEEGCDHFAAEFARRFSSGTTKKSRETWWHRWHDLEDHDDDATAGTINSEPPTPSE